MTMMPRMRDLLALTRDGRLSEAMALLRADRDGTPTRQAAPKPPDAARAAVLDLVPPNSDGGAWTAPPAANATSCPGAFTWHEIAGAAGRRRYKLYVSEGSSIAPRPLVLMLHGCTQSPDDFAAGTKMNTLADEMGLLVAYPEQTSAHNSAKCWNWFKPTDQHRGAGEAALLAGIVEAVARDTPVDRARVFVAGLSAGGAAAAVLAHEYPDVFRAACVHSGLACGAARDLPSAFTAMKNGAPARMTAGKPVPTVTFHGSLDATVNPANSRHVLADATAGLADPAFEHGRALGGAAYTREVWRDGQGRLRAEAWTIEGAGHAWSGGSPSGSYTDPRGPDASRAMMRFFLDAT